MLLPLVCKCGEDHQAALLLPGVYYTRVHAVGIWQRCSRSRVERCMRSLAVGIQLIGQQARIKTTQNTVTGSENRVDMCRDFGAHVETHTLVSLTVVRGWL